MVPFGLQNKARSVAFSQALCPAHYIHGHIPSPLQSQQTRPIPHLVTSGLVSSPADPQDLGTQSLIAEPLHFVPFS